MARTKLNPEEDIEMQPDSVQESIEEPIEDVIPKKQENPVVNTGKKNVKVRVVDQIPCEICAHYTDMEDFFSDWTALGYSRTEARKLMHGGIGEFMKLPAGAGYVRFAL